MTCDRCYRPLAHGDHGLGLCPVEPRRGAAVRPDSIPGGILIRHGLCNEDGTPRRYDSESEIKRECAVRGLIPWGEVYDDSRRSAAAREWGDWKRHSAEGRRARQERQEQRRERRL